MRGTKVAVLAFLFVLVAAARTGDYPIGMNIGPVWDWEIVPFFVDGLKAARCFGVYQSWQCSEDSEMGDRGYPYASNFDIMLSSASTDVADYHVGNWTFVFHNANPTITMNPVLSSGTVLDSTFYENNKTMYITFNIPAGSPMIIVAITNYTALDTEKQIEAYLPNYDIWNPPTFTREFLEMAKGFNTFRFLDWSFGNYNEGTAFNWTMRTPVENAMWGGQPIDRGLSHNFGVPYEIIAELCNLCDANLWLNIPVGADDDYMQRTAKLFDQLLNPWLIINVEYVNELWNTGFSNSFLQYNYANSPEMLAKLDVWDATPTASWGAEWASIGWSAKIVSDNFAAALGKDKFGTRYRPILAAQQGYDVTQWYGLAVLDYWFGDPSEYIWACAGAPYTGCNDGSLQGNVDDYITCLNESATTSGAAGLAQLETCTSFGLDYYGYEGGFGIIQTDVGNQARDDPRFESIVQAYFKDLHDYGFGLTNHYALGSYAGNWPYAPVSSSIGSDWVNSYELKGMHDVTNWTFTGRAASTAPNIPGWLNGPYWPYAWHPHSPYPRLSVNCPLEFGGLYTVAGPVNSRIALDQLNMSVCLNGYNQVKHCQCNATFNATNSYLSCQIAFPPGVHVIVFWAYGNNTASMVNTNITLIREFTSAEDMSAHVNYTTRVYKYWGPTDSTGTTADTSSGTTAGTSNATETDTDTETTLEAVVHSSGSVLQSWIALASVATFVLLAPLSKL